MPITTLTSDTIDLQEWTQNGDGKYYGLDKTGAGAGGGGGGPFAITNVSGTWAEGQTLTISGAQFGIHGPKILAADNFYGKADGQALATTDPQVGSYYTVGGGVYDDTVTLGGNVALKCLDSDIGMRNSNGPVIAEAADDGIRQAAGIDLANWNGFFPYQEYCLYFTRYATHNFFNYKDFWVMYGNRGDNPNSGSGPLLNGNDMYHPANEGALAGRVIFGSNTGNIGGGTWYPKNDGGTNIRINTNAWNYETVILSNQDGVSPVPQDYYYRNTGNGWIAGESSTVKTSFQGSASDPTDHWDRMKCGWWFENDGVPGNKRWYGCFYLAVTDNYSGNQSYAKCRVEVFSSTDMLATTTKHGVLPVTSWGDSSITFNCWTLGIPEDEVYLRVIDKDGNATPLFKLT